MGLQIGLDPEGRYVMVLANLLVLIIDEALSDQIENYNRMVARSEIDPGAVGLPIFEEGLERRPEHLRRMDRWIMSLPLAERIDPAPRLDAVTALGFVHLGPRRRLPPPPRRASIINSHLPFHGFCSGNEIFYRYESYPSSRRIDQLNSRVTVPGTYAAPMSDLPLVPTGLSAVARYALPTLLPARWRYELRPEPGTLMRYGASVPLNGQSGGGVEVMFPNPFQNSGPIANPVILQVF